MEELPSQSKRIHINLIKRLDKFIKDYKDIRGLDISFTQASLLLDNKIEKIGGLKA